MKITDAVLVQIDARAKSAPRGLGQLFESACAEFGIDSPVERAAFLAQMAVESAGFCKTEEDLCYTRADRIASVFSRAFDSPNEAAPYVRNPRALACRAYAGVLGNGPESSGDGWRHRGLGYKQLTGKANQEACFLDLYGTKDIDPERLQEPDGAARSAGWFWWKNRCGEALQQRGIDAVTRIVNGPAMLGKDERRSAFERAKKALGVVA